MKSSKQIYILKKFAFLLLFVIIASKLSHYKPRLKIF